MCPFDPPRRGRPPKPTEHPVGGHMRQRREALGLTVREVALRVRLRESSASYLSQIESGAKTPHPALALRLAEALGDDPRIYLAWAATGKRSDPVETARAVQALAGMLGHPRYTDLAATAGGGAARRAAAESTAAPEDASAEAVALEQARPIAGTPQHHRDARALPGIPPAPQATEIPQAKILVPEIEEGADPGDDSHAGPRVLGTHRIAAGSLAGIEPPVRPFAFRVSSAGARRVDDVLAAGDLAVVSRRFWPLERFAPHAVRLSGHLVLSRALWNGRQLLLLPGTDGSDFIVLDAPDRTALERLIAGRVVARVRAGE